MRRNKIIVILLCLLLLISGCGDNHREDGSRYKVYLITKSTTTQFWLSVFAGANASKAEYNIDLTILGPETEEDFEKQNEYIRQAVNEGADVIVFSAISYTGNAEAINEAAKAGVRIVIIDSDVDSQGVDVRIGTDNLSAGRMTGTAVLSGDEKEIYAGIVNFDIGSRNGQEREKGLREVLSEDERVKGIYTVNVAATSTSAVTGAGFLMAEHPEINVLIGLNEPLAVGTGIAADTMGLKDRVRVIGFDTNVQCVDMMREGTISALIAQNPYAMGYLGVECAWKLMEGERFDPDVWLDTSTTIITRENMFTPESQKALFSF